MTSTSTGTFSRHYRSSELERFHDRKVQPAVLPGLRLTTERTDRFLRPGVTVNGPRHDSFGMAGNQTVSTTARV